ncbi:MAG: hypothetical protein J6I73_08900 [Treponema sp.]|nr:hypothetical protein [Treponema sp.]
MRLTGFCISLAVAACILLASCQNEGFSSDYRNSQSKQGYAFSLNSQTGGQQLHTGVSVFVSSTAVVAVRSPVIVTITSPLAVNIDSLDAALNFFPVFGGDEHKVAVRGEPLYKIRTNVVRSIADEKSSDTKIVVTYDVDFSPLEVLNTDTAIYVIDATVLKNVAGAAMLNEDGGDSAGDETDSIIDYANAVDASGTRLPITKADGTLLAAVISPIEKSHPSLIDELGTPGALDFNGMSFQAAFNINTNSYDGRWKLTFDKVVDSSGNVIVDFSNTLSKIYSYQILLPGEKIWSKPLFFDFSYVGSSGDDFGHSEQYVAFTQEAFLDKKAGTKIRVLRNFSPNIVSPAYFEEKFGRLGRWSYAQSSSRTEITSLAQTVGVYTADPSYIVSRAYYEADSDDAIAALFEKGYLLEPERLQAAQRKSFYIEDEELLPLTFKIMPRGEYRFVADKCTDFIVTDSNNKLFSSRIALIVEDTEPYVRISLAGSSFPNNVKDVKLWVGKKTSITDGRTVKSFGTYDDNAHGDASGYVELPIPVPLRVNTCAVYASDSVQPLAVLHNVDVHTLLYHRDVVALLDAVKQRFTGGHVAITLDHIEQQNKTKCVGNECTTDEMHLYLKEHTDDVMPVCNVTVRVTTSDGHLLTTVHDVAVHRYYNRVIENNDDVALLHAVTVALEPLSIADLQGQAVIEDFADMKAESFEKHATVDFTLNKRLAAIESIQNITITGIAIESSDGQVIGMLDSPVELHSPLIAEDFTVLLNAVAQQLNLAETDIHIAAFRQDNSMLHVFATLLDNTGGGYSLLLDETAEECGFQLKKNE